MPKYEIPNLKNACRVLKLLSEIEGGLRIGEICEAIDLPRTTALRILSTLEEEGFLVQQDRTFRLGSGLIPLGMKALSAVDIRKSSRPVLHELANRTGETAHLAILVNNRSVIIEVVDSPHPLRVASQPGTAVDLHCSATGKVLLAFALGERRSEVIPTLKLERRTHKTLTTPEALERECQIIMDQGFATDDEEFYVGVRCLAAPVFQADGRTIAAIGVTGSTSRFTLDKLEPFSRMVREAGEQVSQAMGYGCLATSAM